MSSPIVYFEIAGPDGASLRSFFKNVFEWEIDGSSTISSRSTGGLRGGIREDPADKVIYMGVDDIDEVLASVKANGGRTARFDELDGAIGRKAFVHKGLKGT